MNTNDDNWIHIDSKGRGLLDILIRGYKRIYHHSLQELIESHRQLAISLNNCPREMHQILRARHKAKTQPEINKRVYAWLSLTCDPSAVEDCQLANGATKILAMPNKTQLGVEAMTGISLYQCISYSNILHNIVRVENCQLSKTTNMLNSTVAFGEPLPADPNNRKGCFPEAPRLVLHAGDVATSGCNHSFRQRCMARNSCCSSILMTGATKLLIKYACISLTSRQRATKRKPSWHVAKGWMCRDFQRWQSYRNQHAVSSSCLVQWGVLTVCCHR